MSNRAENTAAAILTAAEALFLERTYADVTMREIAERAGVTTGALYHHFTNKEALYVEMLRADFARKREALRALIDPDAPAAEDLRRITHAFVHMPPPRRDLMHLVRRDVNAFKDPVRGEIIRLYQRALPGLIEEVMRRGIARGELRAGNPRLMAWQFIALLEVTLAPAARRILGDLKRVVDEVLEVFLRGAATPPERQRASAPGETGHGLRQETIEARR